MRTTKRRKMNNYNHVREWTADRNMELRAGNMHADICSIRTGRGYLDQ